MIVVVDYGMGNLGSIANMLKKVGARSTISSDVGVIEAADKLILPGVGAFDHGMQRLNELGLLPVHNKKVLEKRTPVLGLCLGMQLFTQKSEEGTLPGLGWIQGETVRFRFSPEAGLKIPHMGWNTIKITAPHAIWEDMYSDARFYFVHSYHVVCANAQDVSAVSCYGYDFASVVARDNIVGTQFHPEKSHKFGMKLFRNFVEHF